MSESYMQRKRRPVDNYTMVSNRLARDTTLPMAAKGLALWLLSHDESFRFSMISIARAMGASEHAVRVAVKALEAGGYLERQEIRDDAGRMTGMVYLMDDDPLVTTVGRNATGGDTVGGNPDPYKKTKFQEDQKDQEEKDSSSPDGDGALFAAPEPIQKRAEGRLVNLALDEEFETTFWPEYPRKVGKDAARVAYRAARRRGATVAQVMEGLRRFVKEKADTEKQFIPHPSTWLNAGRWADEPEPVGAARPANGHRPYQNDDYWSTP